MRTRIELAFASWLVLAALSLNFSEGTAQTTETPLSRALDRAVQRVLRRGDLEAQRGTGFNRDSFDVRALAGLGRTDDSTIIGWFSGFSAYINGTDSTACHQLMSEDPTGSRIAAVASTMDSTAVEQWTRHWETAVVASYLAPTRPKVDDEEMMVAVFALIAKLPETQVSLNRKPSDKPPKKTTPAEECGMMRSFFAEALALEDPTRMTLLRGLAMTINEKKESMVFIQE